jgi:hypothetical protein
MALLTFAAAALALLPARLPPVDQCRGDASFLRFRSELARTIERHDAKGLLRIVADDVMVDFDASRGPREFAHAWKLDGKHAADSPVWNELATVMRLGCTQLGAVRIMPSLGEQLGDADPLETFLALPGAVLRASPSSGGRAISRLDYDVVTLKGSWPTGDWMHVALSGERSGYLRKDEVRTALQYRAGFEKAGGRWRMTSFVQGD